MVTVTKKKPKTLIEMQPPLPNETIFVGGMSVIKWVSEARPDKDLGPAMSFYLVRDGQIRATNGKLTASYPWPDDAEFLVSGAEFEKVLARMEGDEPVIKVDSEANTLTIRSGRFHAKIGTLPAQDWVYPGVDDATWRAIPTNFVEVLRSLRAFISDNPAQEWMGCVALEGGNMYATNGIAVAGCACDVGEVQALLPSHAVDFLLRRVEGLESWAWSEKYVAFKWSTGAWVRSQLVIGKFPERAAQLVRDAYGVEPTQVITEEFRKAFADVAGLSEDEIRIYADRMVSKFKRSEVVAPCECEVPVSKEIKEDVGTEGKFRTKTVEVECSVWGAAVLAPIISQATHWSPSLWPKPAPFRGEHIAGFIVGRKE